MNRNRFLVTYDISDDKRLRKVFRIMTDYGDHIQYSVFICELTDREYVKLKRSLDKTIHHRDDQILFFRLGSASVDVETKIDSIGRDFEPQCRTLVV